MALRASDIRCIWVRRKTNMEAVVSKGRNLSRTSLFIRAEQLDQLRMISAQTGATIAFMVRQGIDNYLDGHRLPSVKDDAGGVTSERSR